MKKFVLVLVGLIAFAGEASVFFRDGAAAWTIRVSTNPDPTIAFAAAELKNALKEISGADFPIVKSDEPAPANSIVIGSHGSSGDDETITVKTLDGKLFLGGSHPRCALYAVYSFLENQFGVRWLWPGKDGEFLPPRKTYALPELDYTEKPAFRFRGMFNPLGNQDIETWCARNGLNAWSVNTNVRDKAGFHRIYGNHMVGMLKGDKAKYPQLFGLRQGERIGSAGCWSNPDFLALMIERVSAEVEKYNLDIVNPYPSDVTGRCECNECARLPSGSARWWGFYEKLRAGLKEKHPGLRFAGLAYQEYRDLPTAFPGGLEVVEYAHYNRCYVHKADDPDCALNRKSFTELKEWSKLIPMGIYGYEFDLFEPTAYMPFWNMLSDQMKTFHKLGLVAIRTEYFASAGKKNRLSAYLYARLLRNPDADVDAILADFCRTAYGPASEPMADYHRSMAKAWDSQREHYSYFLLRPDGTARHFLSDELVLAAHARFDDARKALNALPSDDFVRARALKALAADEECFDQWEKLYDLTRDDSVSISVPEADSFDRSPAFAMTSPGGKHQKTEVLFRHTRDTIDIRVICAESDMASLRKGPGGHDPAGLFDRDHVELFLDGGGGEYRHFACNAAGGRYDAIGQDASFDPQWTSRAELGPESWTVDVSVPFAELGIPKPGTGTVLKIVVNRSSRPESCGFPSAAYHNMSAAATLYIAGPVHMGRKLLWLNGEGIIPNAITPLLENGWSPRFFRNEDHAKANPADYPLVLVSPKLADRARIPTDWLRGKLLPALKDGAVVVVSYYGAPPVDEWFGDTNLIVRAELYKLSHLRKVTAVADSAFVLFPDDIRDYLLNRRSPPGAFLADSSQWEWLASQKMDDGKELPFLICRPYGKGLLVLSLLFTPSPILNNLLEYNRRIER